MRRVIAPSPTRRSFLRNHTDWIVAIDISVAAYGVVSAFVLVILAHDRRRIVRFDIKEHPTAVWLSRR